VDDNPDTGRMVWSWTYGCERFFTVWGDDDMQKKVAAAKRVYLCHYEVPTPDDTGII
jgi:hypothetical protein